MENIAINVDNINSKLSNNVYLGHDNGVIYWYVWGRNINVREVTKIFGSIFSAMVKQFNNVEAILFYAENIGSYATETSGELILKKITSANSCAHYRTVQNQIYSSFISDLVMIERDTILSLQYDANTGGTWIMPINFTCCHALLAGQLNYLQSKIRTKNRFLFKFEMDTYNG